MNKLRSFDEHLDKYRGTNGTASRMAYDEESLAFRLGVMLKETRKSCNVTQVELAERTGPNFSSFNK